MFTVVTQLVSSSAENATLLATSMRSGRYPHRTPWVDSVRQLLRLLPLLVGAADEVTVLIIPSFRHYVESSDLPLRHVRVLFLAGDGNESGPRTPRSVEVVGGRVRIGEELGWFQELLHEWFFACLLVGTSAFATFYFVSWHVVRAAGSYLRRRYGLCEDDFDDDYDNPPCDLNLDDGTSLGGIRREGRGSSRPHRNPGVGDDHSEDSFWPGSDTERRNRRRTRRPAAVVEEEDDDDSNWEELRRGTTNTGSNHRSFDDDSFSTPPQG
jgi:hypothetical protein